MLSNPYLVISGLVLHLRAPSQASHSFVDACFFSGCMFSVWVRKLFRKSVFFAGSSTMKACGLPDVDIYIYIYILKRMYDYTGHLVRIVRDKPEHFTGKLLGYRDAEWKDALMQVVGHQGHKGRFSPWSWERQYDSFFRSKGHSWRDVACDRELWHSFRSQWIRYMLGCRAANSRFGAL